jgi:hypothetical protein
MCRAIMAKRKARDGLIIDAEPEADGPGLSRYRVDQRRIDFAPPPPEQDVLDSPLIISQRPRVILPQRGWFDRQLDGFLSFLRTEEEARRQEAHRTIAQLIAMGWPRAVSGLRQKGWLTETMRPVRPLRHAQQLIDPFETMMAVPPQLATERRALEILLAMILRELAKQLSERKDREFAFEARSRWHGLVGYKYERLLKTITYPEERFEVLQDIVNNYYQAINYYHCSLLARDFPINEGTLFGLYCRAVFFMARLDRDGALRPQPVRDRLPSRERILFLLTRDRALRRRYGRDPDYAARIRALVRAFPNQRGRC